MKSIVACGDYNVAIIAYYKLTMLLFGFLYFIDFVTAFSHFVLKECMQYLLKSEVNYVLEKHYF